VILKATTAPVRLMTKMKASNEITVEAWLKRAASVPANQSPANIVTLSLDTSHRNFTLGQDQSKPFAHAAAHYGNE